MNILNRNILALIVGFLVGSAVNMTIVILGPILIPPPPGVDVTSMESLAATMHLFEPKHFISPFSAHALGTFVGALVAFLIAVSYRRSIAGVIGLFFLAGGVYMVFVIPSPVWFTLLDLVAAYIPMVWLAVLLGQRFMHR